MPGIKVPTTIFKGDVAPEQFFCVSCKLLLKDPVQSACGHRFCKSCADEIIGQDARPLCPECGEEFKEEDGAQVSLYVACIVYHISSGVCRTVYVSA